MKKKLKKCHTLQGDPAGGGDSAGGGDGAGGCTDGGGTAGTEMIKSFCIVGVVASNGLRVFKYLYGLSTDGGPGVFKYLRLRFKIIYFELNQFNI